jgi:hypothetical protein
MSQNFKARQLNGVNSHFLPDCMFVVKILSVYSLKMEVFYLPKKNGEFAQQSMCEECVVGWPADKNNK